MIPRDEEGATEEVIGVFHSGKRFKSNRKRMVAEREGWHNDIEERDICEIIHI
jgi:hypothetical protein